ncbi:MAG: heme exporter protein CcmD [Azoarcus sp.]|jgi:heme exporter protein D|nr:heme exporter protein CcmD [Azoarcus sp.]
MQWHWESWTAFWSMGGKGFYVWGSYGVTAALIVLELVGVFRQRRQTALRLRRWLRAAGREAQ